MLPSSPAILPPADTEQTRWFIEEVQPHEPALRAYLHGCFPTLPDTDDLVQDAYARLLRAHDAGKVSHPKAYLFATARNAAACRRAASTGSSSIQAAVTPYEPHTYKP